MPAHHGRQRCLAKKKKKRAMAFTPSGIEAKSEHEVVAWAARLPPGRSYISEGWDDDDLPPRLVAVITTRVSPGGLVIPAAAMVDRTCLGIKSAFVGKPGPERLFEECLRRVSWGSLGMLPCDRLLAQSIVYHALDYARSLGFEPPQGFYEPLFGPRPPALLDTPFARPMRPIYVSGPHDDVAKVLGQLNHAVGAGGFHFFIESPLPDDLGSFQVAEDKGRDS
jgi:hypothetical protein